MKQCGYGYYVDARHDNMGNTGVVDYCKFYRSPEYISADLIFTIGNTGELVTPYYLDVLKGFIPLNEKIEVTEEGIAKFLKSHKATFGVLGTFVVIAEARVKFNRKTGELAKSNISLYLPKTILESLDGYTDNKGNSIPVIITQKCSNKDSFLTRSVNSNIIKMYESRILDFLTCDIIQSKETYMKARLGFGKE